MKEFEKIYLSWRKGQGSRRHIVGTLEMGTNGGFVFSYDQKGVEGAKLEGFGPYTEFPDISIPYNGNVLDIFAQRLIKSERPDIQSLYRFWEIDPAYKDDKFYMLAHTQGLLPTDNFEFLADYQIVDNLQFVTELAGLSKYQLSPDTLKPGDHLHVRLDIANEYDKEAVMVYKDDVLVGYIKKIHCRVFHKSGAEKLQVSVKAVDSNGIIKRAFVKVSLK